MSRGYPLGAIAVALWLAAWQGAGARDPACAAPAPVCAALGAAFFASGGLESPGFLLLKNEP